MGPGLVRVTASCKRCEGSDAREARLGGADCCHSARRASRAPASQGLGQAWSPGPAGPGALLPLMHERVSSTRPVYTLNKLYLQLHCSGTLYLAGLYAAAAPFLAGPKPAAGGLQGQGHDAAVTVRARTTHPPEDRLDAPAGRLGSSSSDRPVATRAAHSARLLRVLKAVLWSGLPLLARRGAGGRPGLPARSELRVGGGSDSGLAGGQARLRAAVSLGPT